MPREYNFGEDLLKLDVSQYLPFLFNICPDLALQQ